MEKGENVKVFGESQEIVRRIESNRDRSHDI